MPKGEGLGAASMIPFLGTAAGGAKIGRKVNNVVDAASDTRRSVFNQAKDRADVPRSQQPTRQWTVGNDPSRVRGESYLFSNDPGTFGRYYEFDTPSGKRVIADHTGELSKGKHMHSGQPKGDPSRQNVDFKQERYQQIGGRHKLKYK